MACSSFSSWMFSSPTVVIVVLLAACGSSLVPPPSSAELCRLASQPYSEARQREAADVARALAVPVDEEKLCDTARAVAKLGIEAPVVWEACASRAEGLGPDSLAGVAWAVARVGRRRPRGCEEVGALEAVAAAAAARAEPSWSPRALSTLAWAVAKVGVGLSTLPRLARCLEERDDMNGQDMATAAWAMATAEEPAPRLFAALCGIVVADPNRLSTQGAATMCWALAARAEDPRVALAVRALARQPIDDLANPRTVALLAWAIAASAALPPDERESAADRLSRRVVEFGPAALAARDAATFAWALATLGAPRAVVAEAFDVLGTTFEERLDGWSPQSVCNALWAMARVGVRRRPATHALARTALADFERYTPRDAAALAWALATLDHADDDLFRAIATHPRLATCEPAGFVNLAFAFAASYQHHRPPFVSQAMAAVAAGARARLDDLNPRQLATVAKGVADCASNDAKTMFLPAAAHAALTSTDLSPLDLVYLVSALGRSRRALPNAPFLVDALATKAIPSLLRLSPKHRALVATALIDVGKPHHRFLKILDVLADRRLRQHHNHHALNDTLVVVHHAIPHNRLFDLPPDERQFTGPWLAPRPGGEDRLG